MVTTWDATPETFDALVLAPRGELVLVDFWGTDCPNCDAFAADVPALIDALGDVPLRIVRVDAYTHTSLANRYGLYGVPTFLLVRDGRLIGKMSQYYGKQYWLGVLRENLPG